MFSRMESIGDKETIRHAFSHFQCAWNNSVTVSLSFLTRSTMTLCNYVIWIAIIHVFNENLFYFLEICMEFHLIFKRIWRGHYEIIAFLRRLPSVWIWFCHAALGPSSVSGKSFIWKKHAEITASMQECCSFTWVTFGPGTDAASLLVHTSSLAWQDVLSAVFWFLFCFVCLFV